jgi:hypothetical protein
MPSSGREAVILIHGIPFVEEMGRKGYQEELLLQGMAEVPERIQVRSRGPMTLESSVGMRLEVSLEDGSTRTLDVYEAFWGDLMTSLLRERLRTRVLRGLELLAFWLFSGIWRGFFSRMLMTVSYLLGLVLLLVWYWGTLALFFIAVGEQPAESTGSAVYESREFLGRVGNMMGGWRIWLLSAMLLKLFPADRFVDVADFVRRYLLNERSEGSAMGLRSSIRKRVGSTLFSVGGSASYSRVTVMASSFGSVIAMELLAHYSLPCPIRLFTLGGSLEFVSRKSSWMRREIQSCIDNPRLVQWLDFYSDEDFFCTRSPFAQSSPRLMHCKLQQNASLGDMLSGRTHRRYLLDSEVLNALLS